MTGDWLDRTALAAGQSVSRRGVLKLAAASALALGPLGTLVRAPEARGARADSGDCLECTLTADARNAADRRACAGVFVLGLGARVACLALLFDDWYDGYAECHDACKPEPRQPQRKPLPPWSPPREKALPPERKKPASKKDKEDAGKAYCEICTTLAKGYCLPCASGDSGYLCCAVPPTKRDPNPCCPKGN